ncbi:LysM peptidoglycan-binding domain-containing protein [Candidatus Omnitrophota bacterium]
MKKTFWTLFFILACMQLTGCAGWLVRTSVSEKERVDQEVAGNRGFITGTPTEPAQEPTFRTRKVYRMEIEVPQPAPSKRTAPVDEDVADREDQETWGNRGYLYGGRESVPDSVAESTESTYAAEVEIQQPPAQVEQIEITPRVTSKPKQTYKVRKGDTLQKISQQLYGTTRKWPLLFQANQNALKDPNQIKPGQVLIVPEPGEYKK